MTIDQILDAKGADGRNALRSYISNHPNWDRMRVDNGLDMGGFTMPAYKTVAAALYAGNDLTEEQVRSLHAAPKDNVIAPAPQGNGAAPANPPLVIDVPQDDLSDDAQELAKILERIGAKGKSKAIDETAVRAIVNAAIKEALADATNVVRVEIKRGDDIVKYDAKTQHKLFPTLIKTLAARHPKSGFPLPVWLSGPAGAGKTYACESASKAYGVKFYHQASMLMPHDLLGYQDGYGNYHSTQFVDAYRHGGFVLLDEVDAGGNEALLALKGAMANGHIRLPLGDTRSWIDKAISAKALLESLDGHEHADWIKTALDRGIIRLPTDAQALVDVPRHPDCYILAAGNTWGMGATNDYIGRNKLDAAFLDEFIKLDWQYDESFERSFSGNVDWAVRVQKARSRARSHAGLKVIISPRATVQGAALIAAGFSEDEAAKMTYLAGLSEAQVKILEGTV